MDQVVPTAAQQYQQERQKEVDLLQTIRAHKETAGLWSLRSLLQLRLTRLDSQLRRCLPSDFQGVQAQAQVIEKLIDEIFVRTA